MTDPNRLDERFEGNDSVLASSISSIAINSLLISRDIAVKHIDYKKPNSLLESLDNISLRIEYAKNCIKKRESIKAEIFYKYDYTLVSLGFDCLPRTISAKYGLIGSRASGRLTCPFDLSVHPLKSVITLLSSGFSGYFNSEHMEVIENKIPRNKILNILFNHDRNPESHADDFKGFMDIYRARVNNFKLYTSRDNVLFLINVRPSDSSHLEELLILLNSIYPSSKCIILSSCHNAISTAEKFAFSFPVENKIPHDGYRWFMAEDFASEHGYKYECGLVDKITDLITRNFKLKQY